MSRAGPDAVVTGRSAPGEVVVGLDAGTTGVKAAAFAPGSDWRAVAEREYPLHEPSPGQAVQDPARILEASADALAACMAASRGARVLGVCLSAAMHGLVGLDAGGRPRTPLVTWADHRADEEARALAASPAAAALLAATGLPAQPMTPLAKLAWYARHEPATWREVAAWAGLKELLVAWLTGTIATETSSASATGLFDLERRTWSSVALELCGLDVARLAPVRATTDVLFARADAADRCGIPAGTPVVLGAADGPLANVGAGALAPGVAACSLGTSAALRVCVTGPRTDPHGELFCFALTEERWVVGGALSNGAAVLRWAGEALAPDIVAGAGAGAGDADEAVAALAAGVPPGSEGLAMVPFLLGERAPLWGLGLEGAFVGIAPRHGRAHFFRAAMEGICLQLRVVLDRLETVHPVREIRATGGAFRSELWRALVAAALGRPVVVADGAAGTALGAAALGLVALGAADDLEGALALLEPEGTVRREPTEPRAELVAAFEELRASLPGKLGALGRLAGGA